MEANDNKKPLSEEERAEARRRTNARIAHGCSFLALVIILVDLAAFVIRQDDWFFATVGIMVAIALLAIAQLNNPTNSSKK